MRARARRLRDGLLEPVAARITSVRQGESRSLLHERHGAEAQLAEDRRRRRRPGAEPRTDDRRGRRRNDGAGRDAVVARLRPRRRDGCTARRSPREIWMPRRSRRCRQGGSRRRSTTCRAERARRSGPRVSTLENLPAQRLAQLQAVYDGAPVGLAFHRRQSALRQHQSAAGRHERAIRSRRTWAGPSAR